MTTFFRSMSNLLWGDVRVCGLGFQPVQHARERDRLAEVLDAADPGDAPFDAHADPAVRDRAVFAQVEIPVEGFLGELVGRDLLSQKLEVGGALAPTDDLA